MDEKGLNTKLPWMSINLATDISTNNRVEKHQSKLKDAINAANSRPQWLGINRTVIWGNLILVSRIDNKH